MLAVGSSEPDQQEAGLSKGERPVAGILTQCLPQQFSRLDRAPVMCVHRAGIKVRQE